MFLIFGINIYFYYIIIDINLVYFILKNRFSLENPNLKYTYNNYKIIGTPRCYLRVVVQ